MKGSGLDLVPITVVSESHRVQPWGDGPHNLTILIIFPNDDTLLGYMQCNQYYNYHLFVFFSLIVLLLSPSYLRIISAPNPPTLLLKQHPGCAFIIYRPCTTHYLSTLVQGQGRSRNQRSWFLLFCKERSDLQNPFCNELQWTKWNLQKLQKQR